MAGDNGTWFLYVNEPTSEFEFSKHGLGFGNIYERYRMKLPDKIGTFDSNDIVLTMRSEKGYSEVISLSGGMVKIIDCSAEIELLSNNESMSFNGKYKIPAVACHNASS